MSESSTRYCNYANDRFGNELSICSNSDFSKEEINNRLSKWGETPDSFYSMCKHIADRNNNEFEIIDYLLILLLNGLI